MKLLNKTLLLVFAFLITINLAGCDASNKDIITSDALFPSYTLEKAVDTASCIVYGEVISKGEPVEVIHDVNEHRVLADCYREVTLEVISCVKGNLKSGETLTYHEYGGETDDRIYVYSYVEEAAIGDKVLIFRGDSKPLSPALFWIVEDEASVPVSTELLPREENARTDSNRELLVDTSVEAFLDLIEAEMAN